jgi:hypothetical protein
MKRLAFIAIPIGLLALLSVTAPVMTGCSSLGGTNSATIAAEVADIQGIQVAGDAAAGGAILYAGLTSNTNLAAQVVKDQQNFDALCQSGEAAVEAGTNASFATIEANLEALAMSIEQSFATPTTTTPTPAVAKAVASSRASLSDAKSKVAAAQRRYFRR